MMVSLSEEPCSMGTLSNGQQGPADLGEREASFWAYRDWMVKAVWTTHLPPAPLTEAPIVCKCKEERLGLSVSCYQISPQGLLDPEESCKADALNSGFAHNSLFFFWAVYVSHLHTPWGLTDCSNSNICSGTHSWNFLAVWFKRRLLFPLFVLTRKSIHLKSLLIPFLQSTIATCISL